MITGNFTYKQRRTGYKKCGDGDIFSFPSIRCVDARLQTTHPPTVLQPHTWWRQRRAWQTLSTISILVASTQYIQKAWDIPVIKASETALLSAAQTGVDKIQTPSCFSTPFRWLVTGSANCFYWSQAYVRRNMDISGPEVKNRHLLATPMHLREAGWHSGPTWPIL